MIYCYNEWGRLEEIIVGTAFGARVPQLDRIVRTCVKPRNVALLETHGGQLFPPEILDGAQRELDGLAASLRARGIIARRPEDIDHSVRFATPHFATAGVYAAMPRDVICTLGSAILEAPMGWPQRRFEFRAYSKLLEEYVQAGADRLVAPKPGFVTTDDTPLFDAADIVKAGADIFIQRSQVTNRAGVAWIERHLPRGLRLRELSFDDPNPMHIDSTFLPLRPGLALVNPTRPCHQADMFKAAGWRLVSAPEPTLPDDWPLFLSSPWLSMNVLSLSENEIVVEENEKPTIRLLENLGFSVLALPFRHVFSMGGGFHCATCDIRRAGGPISYGLDPDRTWRPPPP